MAKKQKIKIPWKGDVKTFEGKEYKILEVYSIGGKFWYMIDKEKLLVQQTDLF